MDTAKPVHVVSDKSWLLTHEVDSDTPFNINPLPDTPGHRKVTTPGTVAAPRGLPARGV